MEDCVFCKIADKKINSDVVYEDDDVIAFKDINPAAPIHILIIPKKHISSIMDLCDEDIDVVSKIYGVAKKLASENNIDKKGFRIVANCGEDGGQTVEHMHFHLLGGRSMQWPPG